MKIVITALAIIVVAEIVRRAAKTGVAAELLRRVSLNGDSDKNNWDDISTQGDCGIIPAFK